MTLKKNELKGMMKKGDIVIITALLAVSFLWFLSSFIPSENLTVNIYLDGEPEYSRELSSVSSPEEITVGGCVIKIDGSSVCFISSRCPDGLCVKRGEMKIAGDSMACVPEGVTVELKSGRSNIDGISY